MNLFHWDMYIHLFSIQSCPRLTHARNRNCRVKKKGNRISNAGRPSRCVKRQGMQDNEISQQEWTGTDWLCPFSHCYSKFMNSFLHFLLVLSCCRGSLRTKVSDRQSTLASIDYFQFHMKLARIVFFHILITVNFQRSIVFKLSDCFIVNSIWFRYLVSYGIASGILWDHNYQTLQEARFGPSCWFDKVTKMPLTITKFSTFAQQLLSSWFASLWKMHCCTGTAAYALYTSMY